MHTFFNPNLYYGILIGMALLAIIVWIALTRIEAPYGIAYRRGWGPSLGNRCGWVVMEAPALIGMALMTGWSMATWHASHGSEPPVGAWVCAGMYLVHYFRRTVIFPLLMRGRSRMPWMIALMGAFFNLINVYLLGGWLLVLHAGSYGTSWLSSAPFIIGGALFIAGMAANWQADRIVRHLRSRSERGRGGHAIPRGGLFRYVTAASYLGELTEWTGYAVMTWSWAGAVFAFWTAANLVPRASRLHRRYLNEFGAEYEALKRRRIIPFLY